MPEPRAFNPIETSRKIESSYREYIATTIHFANPELQAQLEAILSSPRFLAKGPYLESAPPYHKDLSVRELVEEGTLCESMLTLGGGDTSKFDPDRPLYTHQVRAIRKAVAGHNYAVVTGTGSGKTECFLLPILNDILAEFEQGGARPGIRAMILYPMNALANDQLKRLRELLCGTDITFGRYTGDTDDHEDVARKKWREENPHAQLMPNEIISRDAIRKNPPNILLTNYSMLEYLLLRPKDAPLFAGAFGKNWRHIAIDEAHVYSGALGTEIAFLLRRLKARIASETGSLPKLHCYATSATIGSQEDLPKVAQFAQDLFGEPFQCTGDDPDVITSKKDQPWDDLTKDTWGILPPQAWHDLRDAITRQNGSTSSQIRTILLASGTPKRVVDLMEGLPALRGLGTVLLGEQSTQTLVRSSADLLDLTDLSSLGQLGIAGLGGDEAGVRLLSAMVEVLSAAQRSEDVPIMSSRYHSFLRAPEGLFIDLSTMTLSPHKAVSRRRDDGSETPIYEISVCRHCGQAYILGKSASSTKARTAWLNPRHEGTDADDEFIPRTYYRLLTSEKEKDPDEEVQWLCPICGALHHVAEGGAHQFAHEEAARIPVALNEVEDRQADEITARCRHCGYQSTVAIQPMRVSPEAAGSVVCYDLVRDIPAFEDNEPEDDDLFSFVDDTQKRAGSVICFSDKRQDAAFFAPAMERTYGNITRRQLIREAVDACADNESGCSPTAIVNWMASVANRRYPGLLGHDRKGQATAWVLDELAAEDSRNSLEGLGVVRIEATEFREGLRDPRVRGAIKKTISQLDSQRFGWLSEDDYALLAEVCLELLRERNVIDAPAGIDEMRNNRERRPNAVVLGGDGKSQRDTISFAGSPAGTENKRSAFIRKYASRVHDKAITRDDAVILLQSLYTFITRYLRGYFRGCDYLIGNEERFFLSKDLWRFYPHRAEDTVFRCDTCGCETHLDTNGVCATTKCDGHMLRLSFAQAHDKDRFYKDVYLSEALPIRIEEHTAQLSPKMAREIQGDFLRGDVNVLSCTTTFELGVDVGDLRAIFMRNVPPSTANYTQRAGRVGRRAGKPGYAITFARLRPHDIAHFADPRRIIAGETRVPACYLENTAIAIRHVFAVLFSEFFRKAAANGKDYAQAYDSFMDLSSAEPNGVRELAAYIDSHPTVVQQQLAQIFSDCPTVGQQLGIADWRWKNTLLAAQGEQDGGMGRLLAAHALKHEDYARLSEAIAGYQGSDDYRAGKLMETLGTLKKAHTISTLAENGILPKYGFPTDLVGLSLPETRGYGNDSQFSLQRGMRQAIREYAPGAEIVAGKELWRSVGIRSPRGQVLQKRRYGSCPQCGAFVWPIDIFDEQGTCPVCGTAFHLPSIMLVPSFGFQGMRSEKGVGLRKPRARGYTTVHFSQHWSEETRLEPVVFPGGTLQKRYASNGQLCVLNAPRGGFRVCSVCNAAAAGSEPIRHLGRCGTGGITPNIARYNALGTSFVSDVLEMVFPSEAIPYAEPSEWESTMWALFTAAARILEIPETELGGTYYENEFRSMSLMIYDDVPGGAGHALQLSNQVERLVYTAYDIVANCSCGEDTCCYGCIANYYNQMRQAQLSRGAAKRILGALIGK